MGFLFGVVLGFAAAAVITYQFHKTNLVVDIIDWFKSRVKK